MNLKSRLIHAGQDRDPVTGASSVPIYLASTYDRRDVLLPGGPDYVRSGNLTRDALEAAIADLEGGTTGLAFASGMAATSSALLLFQPGDHLILSEDIYGGTFRVLSNVFNRWGLEASFVETSDTKALEAAVRPNTRGILVESPSNPLLRITDLAFVVRLAQTHGLLSIIDNTFATPYLQQPLALGFDLVLHSATKFLNGHSDVLAGLAVARTVELGNRLRFIQNAFGAVLGVQDSWLVLRGMKTLAVRLEAAQTAADLIARRLKVHPRIKQVFYPGLSSHPGADVHGYQARGPGAVLSFEIETPELAARFLERLKLPLVAVSLGGVETIVSHPATMSHAAMPPDQRAARGISDALIRCSMGLEDPDDVWDDFEAALA